MGLFTKFFGVHSEIDFYQSILMDLERVIEIFNKHCQDYKVKLKLFKELMVEWNEGNFKRLEKHIKGIRLLEKLDLAEESRDRKIISHILAILRNRFEIKNRHSFDRYKYQELKDLISHLDRLHRNLVRQQQFFRKNSNAWAVRNKQAELLELIREESEILYGHDFVRGYTKRPLNEEGVLDGLEEYVKTKIENSALKSNIRVGKIEVNGQKVTIIVNFYNGINFANIASLDFMQGKNVKRVMNGFLDVAFRLVKELFLHNPDYVLENNSTFKLEFLDSGNLGLGGAGQGADTAMRSRKYFMVYYPIRTWLRSYVINKSSFEHTFYQGIAHEFAHCHTMQRWVQQLPPTYMAMVINHGNKKYSTLLLMFSFLQKCFGEGIAQFRTSHVRKLGKYHNPKFHDITSYEFSWTRKEIKELGSSEDEQGRSYLIDKSMAAIIQELRLLLEAFKKGFNPHDMQYGINYYQKVDIHGYTIGLFMCYTIMIDFLKRKGKSVDMVDLNSRETFSINNFARFFQAGREIGIGKVDFGDFLVIYNRIKHKTPFEFYKMYKKACNRLNISYNYRVFSAQDESLLESNRREIVDLMRKANERHPKIKELLKNR